MWQMTTNKEEDGIVVRIGRVRIATICFDRQATRWKVYIRYMDHDAALEIINCENVSDAMKNIHDRLRNMPDHERMKVIY